MKKKLLYLSQMYPYPLDGGGKIKTYNTLKVLAKKYNIQAVFINEKKIIKHDRQYLKQLRINYKIFINRHILDSVKDNYLYLISNFIRGIPHYVFQYTYKPVFPFITKTIQEFNPDIIHVDHINITQYLPKEKKQIWILENHNVEFYLYWTRFIHTSKLTRKLYLLIEMLLTYAFEYRSIRLFDHIFAISSTETERIKKYFGITNVSTQPLVYPRIKLKRIPAKKPYLLFIGNLGWPPNEDAVEWFLKDMLPEITQAVPQVQFHVVGKRQPMYEKHWPKPKNLYLHGYQKALEPFLTKADIFVMPFRMGGGMRIKSLTALASGLPLVTTQLGIEGLHVEHNKNCIIAHTKQEFINHVIHLLRNEKFREKLSLNAIKYMDQNHGRDKNRKFLTKYLDIIQKFAKSQRLQSSLEEIGTKYVHQL